MDCAKAASYLGRCTLFVGVESYSWGESYFQTVRDFCLSHGIDGIFVKVFDGPNEWYRQGNDFAAYHRILSPLHIVPYGFCYGYGAGSDLQVEINLIEKYMNAYGVCCADIEGHWDNNPIASNGQTWSHLMNDRLAKNANQFFISCFANPIDHRQSDVVKTLLPCVNAWLPQVYTNYLENVYRSQWAAMGVDCVFPTFHMGDEFGPNDTIAAVKSSASALNRSLWEYGYAKKDTTMLESIVEASNTSLAKLQVPLFGQRTTVTGDLQESENAEFNCVAASIAAIILRYENLVQWSKEINPDLLKDAAYGQGYTGGTAASSYVAICNKLGYTLSHIDGNTTILVKKGHELLQRGIPFIFTEDDPYVPASYGWSHVCVVDGEINSGFTVMDPYPPKRLTISDGWAINNFRFNQLWYLEPKEAGMVLSLKDPVTGSMFSDGGNNTWLSKGPKDYRDGKPVFLLGAIRSYYQTIGSGEVGYNGITLYGYPVTNEMKNPDGTVEQEFERGKLRYDPSHVVDNPKGSGSVYPAHTDKYIIQSASLQKQVRDLSDDLAVVRSDLAKCQEDLAKALAGTISQAVKDDVAALIDFSQPFATALNKLASDIATGE